MPKDCSRGDSALAILGELIALLDRYPHLLQYVQTAGLVESRLPEIIREARALLARAERSTPVVTSRCPDCGITGERAGHQACTYPGRVSDPAGRAR